MVNPLPLSVGRVKAPTVQSPAWDISVSYTSSHGKGGCQGGAEDSELQVPLRYLQIPLEAVGWVHSDAAVLLLWFYSYRVVVNNRIYRK